MAKKKVKRKRVTQTQDKISKYKRQLTSLRTQNKNMFKELTRVQLLLDQYTAQ